MLFRKLDFLSTTVGDLLDKTEKIYIAAPEDVTSEVIEIDISDLQERDWWKYVFKDGEDGFDCFGEEILLETELTLEDVIYFSTENEIKDMIERYNLEQLKQTFFELYYLYVKMTKEASEKAKITRKAEEMTIKTHAEKLSEGVNNLHNSVQTQSLMDLVKRQASEIDKRGQIIMNLEETVKLQRENLERIAKHNKDLESLVDTLRNERQNFIEELETLKAKSLEKKQRAPRKKNDGVAPNEVKVA